MFSQHSAVGYMRNPNTTVSAWQVYQDHSDEVQLTFVDK